MLKNVIFLPVGSYEYHGEFLPPSTDSVIAEKVATSLADKFENSLLLPVVNYGISMEHSGFQDTVTASTESYLKYVMSLVDSIQYDKSLVVIINGHGGNSNILGAVESDYNYRNSESKLFCPSLYSKETKGYCDELFGEFDAHAGSVESSLMAFYDHIDSREPIYNDDYIKKFKGSLRFFKTDEMHKEGIIKDTNKLVIDADSGARLHEFMVEDFQKNITELLDDINNAKR